MIASQKEALDQARKHREEAEKATSAKSNFLASMSHELRQVFDVNRFVWNCTDTVADRTPFSAFYGLLDLLDSDQELTESQREIVQTAKQSCELLLKVFTHSRFDP
jgi:signal transduction histidine kinase